MNAKVLTNGRNVVFDGQSLNLMPGPIQGFPNRLMTYYPHNIWKNPSNGSTSWDNLLNNAPQRTWPLKKGRSNMIIMNGGQNDVLGPGVGGDADPAAEIYQDQKDYALAARAAGFQKIVNVTIVPCSTYTGAQNTERLNANALILADTTSWDQVIDLAADSRLQDTSVGGGWYSDGLHWTGAGCQVVADLFHANAFVDNWMTTG